MAEDLRDFFSNDILTGSDIHDEARHIYDYLTGSISAHTGAQYLVQSLQARNALSYNGKYDLSEILDSVVVAAAEQLPETHDALVNLLGALKQQNETNNIKGLVSSLNERWLEYGDPDPSLSLRDEARDEWTNLNLFAALIHKANLEDLSSFALKTLTMALRRRGWRVNWNDESITSDSIIALEGHAPAAAHWIIVCGQRLYDECSDAKEKWIEWETDLDWIVGQAEVYDIIKSLCRQAVVEMRTIVA